MIELSALAPVLREICGPEAGPAPMARCAHVLSAFEKAFGAPAEALFSAPGRTELGGNHTDHQHGRVLAAAVDLDLLAAVRPTSGGLLRILSEGYPLLTLSLSDLAFREEEKNTSAALVRGVAARMEALGASFSGGFDAYLTSSVPGGSGLSSSAAFEVLMGTILNHLFCENRFTPVEVAQIGQWAENVYFGKPCGLMDQTACSVGGVVAIDFADPERPAVERIHLRLAEEGYALCILDVGADHADLTAEYAAIPGEMGAVSRFFGKAALREVPEEEFYADIPRLRAAVGDRAVLRAIHFFHENRRAGEEADALRAGDFPRFLRLVRQSGRSSALYLQNITPAGATEHQAMMLALALCEELLGERGAVRVHGGGFGGTIQAFVPLDMAEAFRARMDALLGDGRCRVVTVRPVGGTRLA